MVCKEDVLLWFKDLECYERIDVMYELLKMCIPFEVRYLGSCIEELGKHTYQEFHGQTIIANDVEKLSKTISFAPGLMDELLRRRVLLYLSLLSSRNYSVANWLYKNILRTEWLEDCIGNIDENVQTEILLLFVMALHHPAFSFEQKYNFNSILTQLIALRETKKRLSPKPSGYGYPPGFGYPTGKVMNTQEIPLVPMKTPLTIACTDEGLVQQPPCLPAAMPPSQEFMAWSLPGFPCGGAPEVPAFPLPPMSPLVSESTSPNHSRSTSPHRIVTIRTPMPPRTIDPMPPPLDPLSSNNFPYLQPPDGAKIPEEDANPVLVDKIENSWVMNSKEPKHMNGVRYYPPPRNRPFVELFHSLNLDGENALHRSNSSSSNSPHNSPPATPSGGSKARVNGMPPPAGAMPPPPPPLCDTTSPPPQTFSSSSVPYPYGPFTAIPTRSIFPYSSQSYRPPFSSHFPSYHNSESSFYQLPAPVMPFIYSSQFTHRGPNCYNCGAMGHTGQDCTGQNIEDITQKKSYTLEFSEPPPPVPDPEK